MAKMDVATVAAGVARRRARSPSLAAAATFILCLVIVTCWWRSDSLVDRGEAFAMHAQQSSLVARHLRASLARASSVAMRAESDTKMCFGHCLQNTTWVLTTEGIPVESEADEAIAVQAWNTFAEQFVSAAERGMFMDTPVAEQDVKYRFRRLKSTLGLSMQETLEIMKVDATPLVVDSDYVQTTFEAMVEGADRERALNVVRKNPAILPAGTAVGEQMVQAEMMANFIGMTRMFR